MFRLWNVATRPLAMLQNSCFEEGIDPHTTLKLIVAHMASLAAWNRWKVKQYIRRYVREIEWLIRLFSVSFFSASGFRLFSVNPGCTALAFERKIWKKQKGCPQREKYRRGRPLSMKILINTLFAGIKTKNKDGYLYQNNRPYMAYTPLVDTMQRWMSLRCIC